MASSATTAERGSRRRVLSRGKSPSEGRHRTLRRGPEAFAGLIEGVAFGERMGFEPRGGPREMHPAKCATCQKDIQVPFKPTEGRPVYCNEHYVRKEGPRRF